MEDGCYCDFMLPQALQESDFPEIEKRMNHIIEQNHVVEREELGRADALARIDAMGDPCKRQYAEELLEKHGLNRLSFYKSGEIVDMCEGPHVETSRKITVDGFKPRSIAGAFWPGDSRNTLRKAEPSKKRARRTFSSR